MGAEDLFQYLAELLYVAIFVAVLLGGLRRFTRVRLDIVLFFGDAALIVVLSALINVLAISGGVLAQDLTAVLLMALPYLLLRLVADFMDVPRWLTLGAGLGLLLATLVLVLVPTPLPAVLTQIGRASCRERV